MIHRLCSPPKLKSLKSEVSPEEKRDESAAEAPAKTSTWKRMAGLAKGAFMLGSVGSNLAPPAAAHEIVLEQALPDTHCRVVLLDTFVRVAPEHGANVRQVVKDAGHNRDTVDIHLDKTNTRIRNIRKARREDKTMRLRSSSLEELSNSFERKVELRLSTEFDIISSELESVSNMGFVNSTANISQGFTHHRMANELFAEAGSGWTNTTPARQGLSKSLTTGYARLFSLDVDKLLSPDPSVHLEERNKLRQAIIDRVDQVASRNSRIAESRQRWDDAVDEFESNSNSVILAAGNEGVAVAELSDEAILDLPEDFFENILDNDQVTTVGATITGKLEGSNTEQEYVALYSTPSDGIDVYANGTITVGMKQKHGTSFAAPLVSKNATDVHCENPEFTSEQVEAIIHGRHSYTQDSER